MSLSLQVTIGNNIAQELDERLTYTGILGEVDPVPLEIIIPSVLGVVVVVVCIMLIIFVCFYLISRKKSMSIAKHEQIVELVATK